MGTPIPQTFLELGKIQKNIFLKIKTSTIKSEKNIYQTIHNTSVISNFFGIFTIFLYFSRFFGNLNSILWKNYTSRLPLTQVTRCNFWALSDFSYHYQHIFWCPNVAPCDLCHPDPGRANLRSNFFCEVFFGTMMILRGSLLTQGVTSSSRALIVDCPTQLVCIWIFICFSG